MELNDIIDSIVAWPIGTRLEVTCNITGHGFGPGEIVVVRTIDLNNIVYKNYWGCNSLSTGQLWWLNKDEAIKYPIWE